MTRLFLKQACNYVCFWGSPFFIYLNCHMKAQEAPTKDKVPGYDQITKGQYELHVLIQSTSGLTLESDSSVDAKIAITAFGKTEYTKVKSGVGVEETFWGEHMYFKTEFQNSICAENQRLLISVYDFNKFSANSLIGNYEIDIQRIYSEHSHTLEHSWLALSNIQRNYTEITGYIKISVSMLGQKDNNIQLDVEPISSITKEKKVLIPPQIQRKTYQITVDVLEGKNIKPADGSTVDSYVGIEFGQIYSVSETVMKQCNPHYKTRVYVPMSLPAVVENIAFRLNDFNYLQRVEVLGSYYLNINQLIRNYENPPPSTRDENLLDPKLAFQNRSPINEFRWVNFYGPQLHTSQESQKNMQQFYPKLAAAYCGSVLMRIKIKSNSQPEIKKQQLSPDDIKNFALERVMPPFVFRLIAKITAAINLFDKNRKYKIVIRIGAQEQSTDFSPAKNGFCFWSIEKSFKIFVPPIQTMPDIFVYLENDKNQRICYLRYQPKLGLILQDSWVKLIPDTAMVNMQSEQGGYLKVGLELKQEWGASEEPTITRKLAHPLSEAYNANKKTGQIVIDLLCGESLIPLDEDGGIDAFFTFSYMQSEVTSSVKSDCLNPVYYERLIIQADILDEQGCPPIIVNAYDKDKLSNQFLGSTFIDVGDAIKNKSLVYGFGSEPQPFWYELLQNGIVTGKFLISIRLLPNYNKKVPKEIPIPKQDYQVNLVIMGLRALKNTGMLSVKQPFIEFDFAGLDFQKNASKQVQQNKLIVTEPKEKGRNVNISTVIPAKISLPTNYKLWPSLSAKVKDNVLGNLYQPTLGYFSINLQNAYLRSKQMRQNLKNRKKALLQNKAKIVKRPEKLEGIHQGLLMNMRNFVMKSLNYNWKIFEPEMQSKLLTKNPQKIVSDEYIIIFPNYVKQSLGKTTKDGKEQEKFRYVQKYKELIMKNGNYMQIGFDDVKVRGAGVSKRNKHYRYVLNQSFQKYYERTTGHRLGVMDEIPIRVGRIFTSNDSFSNLLRNVSKQDMISGKYKGQLFISEYKENQTKQEQEFKQQSMSLLNNLLRKGKICMYLYIIEAANLPPKDNFSHSDPYLVIKSGNKKLSYQKEYFNDEPNPQFFKKVYMVLEFPEDSTIDIEVWDYDPVGGDELIGSVTLDIQDRIQLRLSSTRFNSAIETHNLTCENSKRPQGLIRFWLDLVPFESKSLYREFDISNAPQQKFEVRIIVWSVSDMPCNDVEDMSDLYVQCMFNDQTQLTDVHYRSSTGEGNFNWRMVFPVKLPMKNSYLTFRVFDKDLVTGDDFLASASFNIQQYLEDAFQTNSSVTLMLGTEDLAKQSEVPGGKMHMINGQAMYDRFYIDTNNRTEERPATVKKEGKIQISVQILTEEEARRTPVGKGREDPNQHPFLPKPKARFKFSLNPMTMLGQLCGPKFKRKAACAICCILFLLLVIYGGITFGGGLVGSLVGRAIAG